MRGYRKFCQRGFNFNVFFYFDEGRKDQNTTISGLSSTRQRNTISMACRWWPNIKCWLSSFLIFKRIRTSIHKKPYSFVIFQGVRIPCPPSLSGSAHDNQLCLPQRYNCILERTQRTL